jgi:hypothetical protein
MERLRQSLDGVGIGSRPHEPPRTLAARVRERLGTRAEALAGLLDALDRQRYAHGGANRPDPGLTRRFKAEARRLRAAT